MIEQTPSRVDRALAQLGNGPYAVSLETLQRLYIAAVCDGVATDAAAMRERLDEILKSTGDDSILAVYAQAQAVIEASVAPLRWVLRVSEIEIERRLAERRQERGGEKDTAPIAIPHPTLDVVNEAEFDAYVVDVDALETVLPALPEDEQKKLLKIVPEQHVPERVIPAHTLPRTVLPGNTSSILAIAKRYEGSSVGKVISAAVTRNLRGFKTTIKPKKIAPAKVSP